MLVEVYRNLNGGKHVTYSIRDAKTRRVIAYVGRAAEWRGLPVYPAVWLTRVVPRVCWSGRVRALRTGRRNVHAVIQGRLRFTGMPAHGERVGYSHLRPSESLFICNNGSFLPRGVTLQVRPGGVFRL